MRHRFKRNHPVTFGGFTLIEAFGLLVKTDCKVGGFNKSPSQVFIAVFAVALAFLLTIAWFFTAGTAAIGGEVAYVGKASNITGLQCDG